MISVEDWLWFVDQALDAMVAIVTDLGDDLANRRPDVAGSNTPYAIVEHCLGVVAWWGGHVVAGRPVAARNHAAEFRAAGPVAPLVARVAVVRAQLAVDVATLDAAAPPRGVLADPEDADLPVGRTQGGALFHVYEELAQHLGQLQGCRDVLAVPWARTAPVAP